MRLLTQLAAVLTLVATATAHTDSDTKLIDHDLSLPDLEKFDYLDAPNWEIGGNANFHAGRLILTPVQHTKGFALNDIPISYDSFTLESVFRSTGSWGKTESGLSLRYVKEHKPKDTSFFGGPSKFDGLNVIVDSDSKIGSAIHVFLDDGTTDFAQFSKDDLYDHAIGSCLLSYQDSQVPITLRAAFYNGVLLVQVNNRICVKTKKVNLPKDYKLAFSAVTRAKHEQFELLRLKTYGGVLSEILENDGKVAPQPKVVTKVVQIGSDGKHTEWTSPIDQKSTTGSSKELTGEYLNALKTIQKSNNDLLSKFSGIESKIGALSSINNNGKDIDLSFLDEHNKQIKTLTSHILKVEETLDQIDQKFINFERNLKLELNSLISTVNKLNDDNINQLRENEQSIEELNKNVQFLVLSEKDKQQNPIHELIGNLKYLIVPIFITTAALSFFIFRLRREIKSKLL